MTDNEMAFWMFGLPMAIIIIWGIALAAIAIVCRAVYEFFTD
jgi:hypothetical protein